MKKYLLLIPLFVIMALPATPNTLAATPADIQAQINALMDQIRQLQQQLSGSDTGLHTGDAVKAEVNIRIRPTPNKGSFILGRAPAGSTGTIRCDIAQQQAMISANSPLPVCPFVSGDYTWWYVKWNSPGIPAGWSVEGISEAQFLTKINTGETTPANNPNTPPTPTFTPATTTTSNTPATTSGTPITVLYPNGGETWQEISTITNSISGNEAYRQDIKWLGAPDDFNSIYNGRIEAYLEKYDDNMHGVAEVGRIPPFAYGSIAWLVGLIGNTNCGKINNCLNNLSLVSPGKYYVRILDTQTNAWGRSNAFTIATNAAVNPAIPVITSINPNQGAENDTITIFGINFANINRMVNFSQNGNIRGGVAPDSVSDNSVTFRPGLFAANSTPGTYQVSVSGNCDKCRSNALDFTIVASSTQSTPVTLSSITPSSGPVGTSVRLDGCGSDSASGFTLVYSGPRNGTAIIPVETLGATNGCGYMTFTVPSDFPTGAYALSVKNNQTGIMSANTQIFTVTMPTLATTSTVSTGTIHALAAKDGIAWNNIQYIANVTYPDSHTENVTVNSPHDFSGSLPGTYTVNNIISPAGVISVNITPSRTQTLSPGGNISFTVNFKTVQPSLTLSSYSFTAGTPFIGTINAAAANVTVILHCMGSSINSCAPESNIGTTDNNGKFSKIYQTTGWETGTYKVWATTNGVDSNTAYFTVAVPTPSVSLSSYYFPAGTNLIVNVSGAPNSSVNIFCRDPNNLVCDDSNPGTTNSNGQFSRTYNTTGWTVGQYKGWATVGGVKSGDVYFNISALVGASSSLNQTADSLTSISNVISQLNQILELLK